MPFLPTIVFPYCSISSSPLRHEDTRIFTFNSFFTSLTIPQAFTPEVALLAPLPLSLLQISPPRHPDSIKMEIERADFENKLPELLKGIEESDVS